MSAAPRSHTQRRHDLEGRLDSDVDVLAIDALSQQTGDRFAARTGFDPRALTATYRWFRVRPRRVQAWREVNELPGRELMRDGRWLDRADDADASRDGGPALPKETR